MIDQYSHYLFDADETLFHFDAFSGMKHMLKAFEVDFTRSHYEAYQAINKPLWVRYQNGEIDAHTLQTKRFQHWSEKLSVAEAELNERFLDSMAEICEPLAGAIELIDMLKQEGKHLAILTNGFTALQERRLRKTGLLGKFDHVVISEQVGTAKPAKEVFDHTFSLWRLEEHQRRHVLMVGDTLASDILGGANAGIDTCWINQGQIETTEIIPTYEVKNLHQLKTLLTRPI